MKKLRRIPKRKKASYGNLILLVIILASIILTSTYIIFNELDNRSRASTKAPSLKLGTFAPPISATLPPSKASPTFKVIPTLKESGLPAKSYCIDDEGSVPGNEPCDDASKFDIKVGVAGVTGKCGSVVAWSQKIMDYLQQGTNGLWSDFNNAVLNCGYGAPPTSPYISSYNVIDSYNLAGFSETTREQFSRVEDLQNWWKSSQAQAAGYRFYSYSPGSIQNLVPFLSSGYVVFMRSHAGILNSIEIDSHGNGWISILHSNTTYWLGVIIVANWNIVNTPGNFSVTGFGGH